MQSEQELVQRLRDHCDITTTQFVREHIVWMQSLANRIIKDRGLADDCVQDAFVSAFNGLEKFNGESSLKTWLHAITVNASLMRLRKQKRLAQFEVDAMPAEFDDLGFRFDNTKPRSDCPAVAAEQADTSEVVMEAISRLPEDYRNVLLYRDIQELNTRETALALGLAEDNVKVRLHRARKALKVLLAPLHREQEI